LARARRYKRHLSIVLFDVDGFKRFNDMYGHPQGDDALVTVARIMREGVRTVDVAARYGGEEFVLILPETDRKGAYEVADKIRVTVSDYETRLPNQKKSVSFTVSGGVASTEDGPQNEEALVQLADQCLYRAKKSGKNRICTIAPSSRAKSRRKVRKRTRKSA